MQALRSGELDPAQVVQALQTQMEQVANLQGMLQQQQLAALSGDSQQTTAALTASGGFKLKPHKPDLFEGKRDPAVIQRWQHQVRMYAHLVNAPDDQQILLATTFREELR